MAVTPQPDEAFLREVDDAVRQDRLLALWRSYGRLLIAAVVLGLMAFGGYIFWQHRQVESSGVVAEKADKMLEVAAGGGVPDAKLMAELSDASQPGYRAGAALTHAAMAVQKGDLKLGAKLYGDIAANESFAQPYRDLALVRQVALAFDTMKPQDVVDRLKPLAIDGEPWFGSAGEMTAIAYMKMGKRDLAGATYAALAKAKSVPPTIGSRARQMAGLLGVDAVGSLTATENPGTENAGAENSGAEQE